jgi:hypothetical protein
MIGFNKMTNEEIKNYLYKCIKNNDIASWNEAKIKTSKDKYW